jgi:ligand-binding sensor protein
MASSFHLTTLGNCHVGIIECRKLKVICLDKITYGITSIPNFTKFCSTIRQLLNA